LEEGIGDVIKMDAEEVVKEVVMEV